MSDPIGRFNAYGPPERVEQLRTGAWIIWGRGVNCWESPAGLPLLWDRADAALVLASHGYTLRDDNSVARSE